MGYFYLKASKDIPKMQKKVTNVLENISEMHFAVASYEIEYSIPND